MYRSSDGVTWMLCAAIEREPHIVAALTTFTVQPFSRKYFLANTEQMRTEFIRPREWPRQSSNVHGWSMDGETCHDT